MANRWNDKKPCIRGKTVTSSRGKSSSSGGPKLSVPPPLNLPSLRKEHQKFDNLGNSGTSSSGGPLFVKPNSSSSSFGWDHGGCGGGGGPLTVSSSDINQTSSLQKHSTVFRGDDFPSLRATLISNSNSNANVNVNVNVNGNENSKEVASGADVGKEEISMSRKEGENSGLSSFVDMGSREKRVFSRDNRDKKEGDFLPVEFPLVRLSSRCEWDDDERDTSVALTDAKSAYSTKIDYWDRDFDFPRSSFPPIKPAHVGKSVPNLGGVRVPSREGREGQSRRTHLSNAQDEYNVGAMARNRDYVTGVRDNGRFHWNKSSNMNNIGNDSNKYKADVGQNSTGIRSSFSFGNKGLAGSDRFGRDKGSSLRNEKPYVEDPFSDGSDPFSGSVLGVVKRKKDASKQLEFHDSARESFEAELERVQKIQEQERQRVIDEQERAMEMARREEEERNRVVREQEEHHRQLEEQAREAVWRAEQERVEAIKREEEKRIARDEEKQRILMEEERRKQAAKQKLIELEEKMARRHSETSKVNDIPPVMPSDIPRADDFPCWEDGERMVERITNSASSDSSLTRPFDLGSRAILARDVPYANTERSKPYNSQRRDVFENGNSSSFFYSKQSYMPTRGTHYRGGMPESHMDDISYENGFPHGRNMDLGGEFSYNMGDRFDLGWGQGRGRGNPPFSEHFYPNPDSDELYTYGRSRYTAQQPRVLPPPLPLVQRNSFREESSNNAGQSAKIGEQSDLDRKPTPGRDLQLSLSVSSPQSSPTHLSHDDLDESRECLDVFSREEVQDTSSEKEGLLVVNTIVKGTSSVSVSDNDEWETENNEELQEEFNEENEVHEGGDEDVELNREFEDMHLEGNDSPHKDDLVLGFDEGVEVGMPNEDYEKSQKINENLFVGPEAAPTVMEQKESFDINGDEISSQSADVAQVVTTNESSGMVQETKEEGDSRPNISMPLDPLNSGHSSSTFNLQFGLFSGPSLIPSPVPSIQIGSIQMPLQLHPQIGPSLTHIRNPQPPLLQFGQFQCPPISQGNMPLISQSMSFVHTNVPPMYSSSQVLVGPPLDPSQSSMKDDALPQLKVQRDSESRGANFLATPEIESGMDKIKMDLGQGTKSLNTRNTKLLLNNKATESRASHSFDNVKDSSGILQGESVENRERKLAFKAKNHGVRSSSSTNEASHLDLNVFQRKPRRGPQRFEFRVRQTAEGNPSSSVPDSKSNSDEGLLKRNISSDYDVETPLQSGVVQVFKQPGIEACSDEDDFIEVRSKRQMLNDRRELREKESKAKSSNMRKGQRKSRASVQSSIAGSMSRGTAPSSGQVSKSQRSTVAKRGLLNDRVSPTLNNMISQLPPIGTPRVVAEYQADGKAQVMKPPQTSTSDSSGRAIQHAASNVTINAQNRLVMALTQTQLEEAMKPGHFGTQIIQIGDHGTSVRDPCMPLSSVIAKDSPFSSTSGPINSLLAGEKIQFGAVTSSTTLFPSTRGGSALNIWPTTASLPSNIEMSERNGDINFGKEKHPNELFPSLEDCVVAAIGNDQVIGNGFGPSSTPISVSKGFSGDASNGVNTGMSGDENVVVNQSKAEDSLSISLPSDLSIEISPVSIWPPLPSPHSSNQVISPFPFYDMNPMVGGPMFSFGPHEESSGPKQQQHQQKSSLSSSGLLGTWQQCHTSVDSFYGPPSGFPTHYISPPGLQGPPHMVVYNHFAPIGQFGQVGLSYMGTTYIPSSKQPDWKHNSGSALGSEGQMGSTNSVNVQCSASNVPPPVPQLGSGPSGSPLLSISSPLPMYDVLPFQQAEGIMPSQSNPGTSSSLDNNRSISRVTITPVTQLLDESDLVNRRVSFGLEAPTVKVGRTGESTKIEVAVNEDSGNKMGPHNAVLPPTEAQSSKQRNSSGQKQYNYYQRGVEWSNRRSRVHVRNHFHGERVLPLAKVKQIYVPKQSNTTGGTRANV